MGKAAKYVVIIFAVVAVAGLAVPVYSQDKVEVPAAVTPVAVTPVVETQAAVSVSGEVVSVDLVKSELVIKVVKDEVNKIYDNQTIAVTPETVITKAAAALKLADIKAGDKVSVTSTTDAAGKTTVVSIAVVA